MTRRQRDWQRLARCRARIADPRTKPAKRKAACRHASALLERLGAIQRPDRCGCGSTARLQRHHVDYTDPFTVAWLCPDCHREEHRA